MKENNEHSILKPKYLSNHLIEAKSILLIFIVAINLVLKYCVSYFLSYSSALFFTTYITASIGYAFIFFVI